MLIIWLVQLDSGEWNGIFSLYYINCSLFLPWRCREIKKIPPQKVLFWRELTFLGKPEASAKYRQYLKFKMEIPQPNRCEIPPLGSAPASQGPSAESGEPTPGQSMDSMLRGLIREEIPPFVVTEDYKIRREWEGLEGESEQECQPGRALTYSRKDKSLMELTRKFIHRFEGAACRMLVLDQITSELNVERRRIYDIINIMESLNVVAKIRKNVYQWKGLKKAVETIQHLIGGNPTEETEKNKKEKSLQSLATEFLKLFSQHRSLLTLEEAAQVILNDVNQQVKKTKIRRLYDIVNVFKCLGLVEKVKSSKCAGGKPVYQWLGFDHLLSLINSRDQNSELGPLSLKFSSFSDQNSFQNYQPSGSKCSLVAMKFIQTQNIEYDNTRNGLRAPLVLRDISNLSESNILPKNTRKHSENSEQKQQSLGLQKRSSLKQIDRVDKRQHAQPVQVRAPLRDEPADMEAEECPSFFHNLMSHLNRDGASTVTEMHLKLTQIMWPSHP